MMPQEQEQVFFSDRSVYVSSTRLALRKGGAYPIGGLAQIAFVQVPARRFWIGILVSGLLLLLTGKLLIGNLLQGISTYSPLLNESFYLVIGGWLLLLGVVIALFQALCPVYAIVLKGNFGTARPIKSRNRRYIKQVVVALNEAINRRDGRSVTYIDQSIRDSFIDHSIRDSFNGQLIKDSFHHASGNAVGNEAWASLPDNPAGNG